MARRRAKLAWSGNNNFHPGIDQSTAKLLLQPRLETAALDMQGSQWSSVTLAACNHPVGIRVCDLLPGGVQPESASQGNCWDISYASLDPLHKWLGLRVDRVWHADVPRTPGALATAL